MKNNYLKHLFSEDIYVINEDKHPISTVNEPVEALQKPESKVETFTIEGNKDCTILIVADSLEDDEKTFLQNVLKAVKLELTEVGIITGVKQPAFSALKEQTNAEILLVFGGLDDDFTTYSIIEKDGCKTLVADSLQTIANNKDKKKALWGNLQQLFLN